MEKYEINKYIEKFNTSLSHLEGTIKPLELDNRIKELSAIMEEPDFWNDNNNSVKVISELNSCKERKKVYDDCASALKDILDYYEMYELEESDEVLEILEESILSFDKALDEATISTILDGEYDNNPCFLEIHGGAGGTEAMDWALMLLRMYKRYCERANLKFTLIDYQAGSEAGIKSACLKISGKNAYGLLKSERGVHRLVRISPFDSSKARHTSFASVDISPIINNADIEINPSDLKIDVYHSSGAGGQSVNTTDSAVRITHLATGIVVTCQNERSQIQNREQALVILKSKLAELELQKREEEMKKLKGIQMTNAFGSQIRSYVFCPYTLVKDHRTDFENNNVDAVMDGDLEGFIYSYLRYIHE